MDWVLYGALALIDAVLLWWIFALRREIRDIRRILENHRPEGGVSGEDLQALQHSLSTLVDSLETYTEDSLAEMRQQVSKMQQLVHSGVAATSRPGTESQEAAKPVGTIRIRPDASLIEHREKERIIALHRQGKSVQEISRELQVTAGEVELVIKLTS
jgi:hypothetical protein